MALVLLIFFAEMYAGSLAPGCWFSKQYSFPKQRIVVIFDAQNCGLGGLVLAFWHPGGSLWYLGGSLGNRASSRKDM